MEAANPKNIAVAILPSPEEKFQFSKNNPTPLFTRKYMMNADKMAKEVKWKRKIPIATFADSVIPMMAKNAKRDNNPIVARIIGIAGIK